MRKTRFRRKMEPGREDVRKAPAEISGLHTGKTLKVLWPFVNESVLSGESESLDGRISPSLPIKKCCRKVWQILQEGSCREERVEIGTDLDKRVEDPARWKAVPTGSAPGRHVRFPHWTVRHSEKQLEWISAGKSCRTCRRKIMLIQQDILRNFLSDCCRTIFFSRFYSKNIIGKRAIVNLKEFPFPERMPE